MTSRLPSPALLISVLALFVALGGSAYAVAKIDGKDLKNRSVAAKKIKKNSLGGTEIKESRLGKVRAAAKADRAVSADTAATATSAGSAANAAGADNAARLGGVAASDYSRRLWAVYDSGTDAIVRGNGVVGERLAGGGPGVRGVKFNRDVSACAWIPARSADVTTAPAPGFISAELSSATEKDTILVRTRTSDNTSFDFVDWHLEVIC